MQAPPPTNQAEAAIPPETPSMSNDAKMNRRVVVRRKAAKRTLPFDLAAGELLVSQDEDNPARKKPRLEDSLPTTTDEVAKKTAAPDASGGLLPPAADNDANADPVTDTQPNAGATRATGNWTLEEDAKLTNAVMNTRKKKCGKEYKTDWVTIFALVPGRTKLQCNNRWRDVLDSNIDRATGRNGKWTEGEDSNLRDAVLRHGGKNWGAISALVLGRTRSQCQNRWHNALNPSIALKAGRTGKWTADEDIKLKDSIKLHNRKDWGAIAALVPGRTNGQCFHRWKYCNQL
jgi:hypothetical protein